MATTIGGRLPSSAISEDNELELLELQLLSTSKSSDQGRFRTQPRWKKFRKSLMSLWSDKNLLDQGQTEQINKILSNTENWDYNAFILDRLTSGANLATLCTHIFHEYGLLRVFKLDALQVWRFFTLVESGYHQGNPYHNGVHAADVTQAMHCFLQEAAIIRYLTPLELLASLIAAACHDLDHPGQNEKFLIATRSHLAMMYDNASVLENHHWRSAMACLHESGLAAALDPENLRELHGMIRECILATDISRQGDYLARLRSYLDNNNDNDDDGGGGSDLTEKTFRHFILQIALKCADISNPCRCWNISRLWSYRASEEFFRQGDRERELGLPVTPFCDRTVTTVAKIQTGFYRFVAFPLFEEWNRFLNSPLSTMMMQNLTSNHARWDLIIQQEQTRNSVSESVASQTSTSSSSSGGGSSSHPEDHSSRRESLLDQPPPRHHRLSRSSADGDDDSDPCYSYPYLPLDPVDSLLHYSSSSSSRRHSLPLGTKSDSLSTMSTTTKSTTINENNHLRRRSTPFIRFGHKRRLLPVNQQVATSSEENSNLLPHRVTFHLGNSLDETTSADFNENHGGEVPQPEPEVSVMEIGAKVARIALEDNKENSSSIILGRRRGSAPSNLLLNQSNSLDWLSNQKVDNNHFRPGPGSSFQRNSRLNNNLINNNNNIRRRGSLPGGEEEEEDVHSTKRSSSCGCSENNSTSGKRKLVRKQPEMLVDLNGINRSLIIRRASSLRQQQQPVKKMTPSCGGQVISDGEVLRELQSRVHLLRNGFSVMDSTTPTTTDGGGRRRGSLPTELIMSPYFVN